MRDSLGNYELVRQLGRGGMAEVYLARQSDLDRYVAIKVLDETDENARAMFVDEARIGSMLSHPNLPIVYEVAAAADRYYLAMEYLDGQDLRQLMNAAGRIPYATALAIVRAAAAGLDHAHRTCGLVHRDVSLTNIMVTREGQVKVIDFGIAAAAMNSHRSMPGTIRGKTRYMSPEQCMGDRLDARSDIFSLGIVLYELVTGQRCFGGGTDFDAMLSIVRGNYVPACARDLELPLDLGRVIDVALATDPAQRYASAAAFIAAIDRVMARHHWIAGEREIAALFSASDCESEAKGDAGGTQNDVTHRNATVRGYGLRADDPTVVGDCTGTRRASLTGCTERGLLRRASRNG
jgi:serine/threonine-protein kinase